MLTPEQMEEAVEAMREELWRHGPLDPAGFFDQTDAAIDRAARAALTAALPVIERARREDLRLRLARAHELLAGVQCPAMNGDNLAVSLCSHFDEGDDWPEGDGPDDCGWSPSAVDGYTQTLDAIRQHYTKALAGEER